MLPNRRGSIEEILEKAREISAGTCDQTSLRQAISKKLTMCPMFVTLNKEGWNHAEIDSSLKSWLIEQLKTGQKDINLLKKLLKKENNATGNRVESRKLENRLTTLIKRNPKLFD